MRRHAKFRFATNRVVVSTDPLYAVPGTIWEAWGGDAHNSDGAWSRGLGECWG